MLQLTLTNRSELYPDVLNNSVNRNACNEISQSTYMIIPVITYKAKLLNADWLRQRTFFLNHDLEGTFGNQERA